MRRVMKCSSTSAMSADHACLLISVHRKHDDLAMKTGCRQKQRTVGCRFQGGSIALLIAVGSRPFQAGNRARRSHTACIRPEMKNKRVSWVSKYARFARDAAKAHESLVDVPGPARTSARSSAVLHENGSARQAGEEKDDGPYGGRTRDLGVISTTL